MAYSAKSRGKGAMTPLEQLIEEINFQRAKEMRQILKDGELNTDPVSDYNKTLVI